MKLVSNDTSRSPANPADEREEVRRLLAHAAEASIGAAVANVDGWWLPVERTLTPVPKHIASERRFTARINHALIAETDHQHGGGACRDAVIAQVRWAQRFLCAEHMRR